MNVIITEDGRFTLAVILTDQRIQPVAVCADGRVLVNEDGFYIMPSDTEELVARLRFLVNHPEEDTNPAQAAAAARLLGLLR